MRDEGLRGRRFLIRGRVQGVGFRAFVWRHAAELGLRGWVRNRRDGRVEVLAWATPSALSALEALLRRGPSWARVDEVQVTDDPPGDPPVGFAIAPDG